MRTRLTYYLFSFFLGLVLLACSPYVTPSLPISGDTVSYRIISIDGSTQHQWKPMALMGTASGTVPDTGAPIADYDYVLGPGDIVSLVIYTFDTRGEKQETRIFPQGQPIPGENEFLVSANGTIELPYVGVLKVAGKPFSRVRRDIRARLARYFVKPQFEARVTGFSHGRVNITGEVQRPGELMLSHEPLTVAGAIQQSGGFLPTADLASATLTRADGSSHTLDLVAFFFQGDARFNKLLNAGDKLNIPRNHGNQVFLAGEVLRPQTLAMHPTGISLIEALNSAGGVQPITGDPSHIYVLRAHQRVSAPKPNVTVYHLDGSNLAAMAMATEFMLQPNDIVYVGIQPITQWSRFINQFIPIGMANIIGPQVDQP